MKSTDSRSQSGSTQSKDTKRSASPTKQKTDLEIMYPSIKFIEGLHNLHEEEEELLLRIIETSRSFPLGLEAKLKERPTAGLSFLINPVQWRNDPDRPYTEEQIRDLWDTVQEVEVAAMECSVEEQPEESWSDDVALPLLKLSLRWAGTGDGVKLANLCVDTEPSRVALAYTVRTGKPSWLKIKISCPPKRAIESLRKGSITDSVFGITPKKMKRSLMFGGVWRMASTPSANVTYRCSRNDHFSAIWRLRCPLEVKIRVLSLEFGAVQVSTNWRACVERAEVSPRTAFHLYLAGR